MSDVIYCSGDSWTYGAGLNNLNDSFCYQLSTLINVDCVNLGVNGGSNSGMFNEVFNRLDKINNSKYDRGYIILTFTENGRDIRDFKNRPFDYISAYKDMVHNYNFYTCVLDDIEYEWEVKLSQLREKIDPRFRIITGCNFAKPKNIKLDIQEPWISLLGYNKLVPRLTCVETTNTLNEILGIESSDDHKLWLIDHGQQPIDIYNFFDQCSYMLDHDRGHPNKVGHQIWAERILCEL